MVQVFAVYVPPLEIAATPVAPNVPFALAHVAEIRLHLRVVGRARREAVDLEVPTSETRSAKRLQMRVRQ
jgi:hypothetical protein